MATPGQNVLAQTGNDYLDLLTNGFYWELEGNRVLNWSISDGLSGEVWADPKFYITIFSDLFDRLETYIDVNFRYVGYQPDPGAASGAGADINITIDAFMLEALELAPAAIAIFPNVEFARDVFAEDYYTGAPGDIFLNVNSPEFSFSALPGGKVFAIVLHEVGHALGLKHTHDDGATGRPTAEQLNLTGYDFDYASIMSYQDGNPLLGLVELYEPQTPMGLDVLALQYLYGANMATRTGDSVYTLPLNDTYITIWDAGGRDLIDLSSHSRGWFVDLPYEHDLDAGTQRLGLAGLEKELTAGYPTNVYWLTGDIEDVLGSPADDELQGNELANILSGNDGHDYIDGWENNDFLDGSGGNDTLVGGSGRDVAYYAGSKAQYAIAAAIEGDYLVSDTVPGIANSGTDSLAEIEVLAFDDGRVVLHQDSERLLFHHGDHTYRVVLTAMTRDDAAAFAQSQNAHLVSISSAAENQAILDFLHALDIAGQSPIARGDGNAPFVWLGAADSDGDGIWQWPDGSKLQAFDNRAGAGSNHEAMAMGLETWSSPAGGAGQPGEWNSLDGAHVLYSIIEWDRVMPVNFQAEGVVLVHGDAVPGSTLFVETGGIFDPEGLGAFAYQWFNNGEAIAGATGNAYRVAAADADNLISVELSYTDGQGMEETVASQFRLPTEPISASYTDLIEMYVVILGRAPDSAGLDFWSSLVNNGKTFGEVAAAMWQSPGARAAYPEELTDRETVATLYRNVLSREPDENGLEFWLEQWQDMGPVDTMLNMIEALTANNSLDSRAIQDKLLFQAKVDIGGYLATSARSDNLELAARAFEYLEAGYGVGEATNYIDHQLQVLGQFGVIEDNNLFV